MITRRLAAAAAALLMAAGGAACGGSDDDKPASEQGSAQAAREALNGADRPNAGEFPQPGGRTLEQMANDEFQPFEGQAGLATSVFTPGHNRVAFGLIGADQKFVYGPSVLYFARTPSDAAIGPIPAPADPLVTDPAYRSRQAASEGDPFAAVYSATLDLEEPGEWAVLAASRTDAGVVATPLGVEVARSSPIPAIGDKAPVVDTDTVEDAGGDVAKIDTRLPPSDMHANFRDVVGKKPVALLFATPQLCQSRVCGPVVDIAAQLKDKYGDRMEFIHQEVFVDNEVDKGLRPPLRKFNLQTEPWLFVVGRDGRVKARLEGSFGLDAFERALQAGLRS